MNDVFNGRYVLEPKETHKVENANNKYIHIGDFYITNLYQNSYYTTISSIKLCDLFTHDILDVDVAINNQNHTYTIVVNRTGQYLRVNNLYCVLETNDAYEEYKISMYLLGNRNEYNLSVLNYNFSKWSEFKIDDKFKVFNELPSSLISFTRVISPDKFLNLTPSDTQVFKIRRDINMMYLSGYTSLTNQSTFKNVNVLYKNYLPSEDVYFVSTIHDDTNDLYYTGHFKWEKNVNHIVLLSSDIPSGQTINYTIYWNVSYFTNYLFWVE